MRDKVDPIYSNMRDFCVFTLKEINHLLDSRKSISENILIEEEYEIFSILDINMKINEIS